MALDSQTKLNREIMNIYDSIKELRNPDNGYVNCQYNFTYTNLPTLNNRFRANVATFLSSIDVSAYSALTGIDIDDLKKVKSTLRGTIEEIDDENMDYIEQMMYELALKIREYDGHTLTPETYLDSDNLAGSEFYNTDYPVITELKRSTSNSTIFLEKIKQLLPQIDNEATYFIIVYYLLVQAIAPVMGGRKKNRKSRRSKRGSRKSKRISRRRTR